MKPQRRTKLVDAIAESEKIAGQIYPVIEDIETGEIIDGRKRKKANPEWRTEKIKIKNVEQRLAIKYHTVWFRQQLDKVRVLTDVAEETGWRGARPFAEFFGIDEDTINKYLPQKYKLRIKSTKKYSSEECKPIASVKKKEVKKTIKKLKEAKKTLGVIAPDNPKIKEKVEEAIVELEGFKPEEEAPTPIMDQIRQWVEEMNPVLSTWESHYDRPLGFGDKDFHGNCSPVIIMALLDRYSFSTHVVLDPMAGSGTFGDVARAMDYTKVYMSDIKPMRGDIERRDAANTEYEDGRFDFIFAHFPYWKLVEYTVDDPLDSSRYGFEEFIEWSERVYKEMERILRNKGYLCVMIGNVRDRGVVDLEAHLSLLGSKYFTLWDKIVKKIRPWGAEKRGDRMQIAVARAKAQNRTMVNHDVVLVFRKD